MSNEIKRLYRSRNDRMVAGVCGGLGEFLTIDPTLIRLIFVFGTVFVGTGLLVYFVMMLVVPEEPLVTISDAAPAATSKPKPAAKKPAAPKAPPAASADKE
ncbi:MAG: PspC domain-containing protein [Anaerolineae bacterium]|nr:PspC domain-containing protein [Anaerolineae bacterium]